MLLRIFTIVSIWISTTAHAELLVTKQRFEMPELTTVGGKVIKQIAVGWESYGQLNADKSNVVLVTHYFTGNSHAAGKYSPDDPTPGYWDAIIGPGKAIDTNRFFVVSVDSLVNLGVHNPHVITTGPATIDPATGKPYGLTFPVVTILDFVNVQKALLESLGISRLHAVVGPSMGSMQAIEWAATYPDWVPRMVSVIGTDHSDPWTTSLLEQWAIPIRLDPNWKQGNYYGSAPPLQGLVASLMFITQDALTPAFFQSTGEAMGYQPFEHAALSDIHQSHSIVNWLRERAEQRATQMDANHLLYLVRACQLFVAGHGDLASGLGNIRAKTLFLPAQDDHLLLPHLAKRAHNSLSNTTQSTLSVLAGPLGHLEGVAGIGKHQTLLRAFLNDQGDQQ